MTHNFDAVVDANQAQGGKQCNGLGDPSLAVYANSTCANPTPANPTHSLGSLSQPLSSLIVVWTDSLGSPSSLWLGMAL